MRFAATLKELREQRGLTQEELAQYLGVTRSTVAGYETKGKQPDYERLLQLAAFFQVSADYLLTGSEYTSVSAEFLPRKTEDRILKAYARLSLKSREQFFDYLQYLETKERTQK